MHSKKPKYQIVSHKIKNHLKTNKNENIPKLVGSSKNGAKQEVYKCVD
jgi:hypothetical protein